MTEPDQRDVDMPSTEVVLSDHYRPKASFPSGVLITLMVIGMIGLGAAGYLLFESQRSLSISTAENADRLSAIASLEAKQNELVALVNSHTGKLATQGDAINEPATCDGAAVIKTNAHFYISVDSRAERLAENGSACTKP